MGLSSRTRAKLAERANWCCGWCGQKTRREMGWQNSATIEHLIPVSRGGSNKRENLMSACSRCNRLRGTTSVDEFRLVAQQLEPDRRTCDQAQNQDRKIHREKRQQHLAAKCGVTQFTYLLVPDADLNCQERQRKDRTLVRKALQQSRRNPFEPGSRRHRMFERELERLPPMPASFWSSVSKRLTAWCSRLYSVCTNWEKSRETGSLQQ